MCIHIYIYIYIYIYGKPGRPDQPTWPTAPRLQERSPGECSAPASAPGAPLGRRAPGQPACRIIRCML